MPTTRGEESPSGFWDKWVDPIPLDSPALTWEYAVHQLNERGEPMAGQKPRITRVRGAIHTWELLYQDVYWIAVRNAPEGDLTKVRLLVDELELDHIRNLIQWIVHRGCLAMDQAHWMSSGPQPSGDMAYDVFDQAISELLQASISQAEGTRFINDTRLMRRLRERLDEPTGPLHELELPPVIDMDDLRSDWIDEDETAL